MTTSILATAAQLALDKIYDPISPSVFGQIYRIGETTCGTALIEGFFYITCQGTENMAGWKADFDCDPVAHPVLGNLHSGFDKNLPALVSHLLRDIPLGAQVVVTGHSKGAGEGSILAARLKLAGIAVVRSELFACPNAGCQKFADWLKVNIPGTSYRNAPKSLLCAGDPVPLVPPSPFIPPYPHTPIDNPPPFPKSLIGIEWHMADLYLAGINHLVESTH